VCFAIAGAVLALPLQERFALAGALYTCRNMVLLQGTKVQHSRSLCACRSRVLLLFSAMLIVLLCLLLSLYSA
jgi:hypothetical protein